MFYFATQYFSRAYFQTNYFQDQGVVPPEPPVVIPSSYNGGGARHHGIPFEKKKVKKALKALKEAPKHVQVEANSILAWSHLPLLPEITYAKLDTDIAERLYEVWKLWQEDEDEIMLMLLTIH